MLQLINRHNRDCAAIAARLGVPHLVMPAAVPESPFEAVPVPAVPGWKETALWWPERRTLVVTEAIGTARYYCAPGQPVGVNPLLRLLRPPAALLRFAPEHLLVGHGAGLHENTAAALERAVRALAARLPPRGAAPLRRGPGVDPLMRCAVVLFTRDLRVHDNPALAAAAREAERVLPLFVLDERCSACRERRSALLAGCARTTSTRRCASSAPGSSCGAASRWPRR